MVLLTQNNPTVMVCVLIIAKSYISSNSKSEDNNHNGHMFKAHARLMIYVLLSGHTYTEAQHEFE